MFEYKILSILHTAKNEVGCPCRFLFLIVFIPSWPSVNIGCSERAGNVQIQGDNDGFVNSGTIVMGNQINETEGSKRNSHGGAAAAGIAGAIGGTTVAGPVGGVVGGAAGLAGGYVVDKFLK